MTNSILSVKKFDTKAPVICRPPPLPPFMPPLPIVETVFSCYAEIHTASPYTPARQAGTMNLYFQGWGYYWFGTTTRTEDGQQIRARLEPWLDWPNYLLSVWFSDWSAFPVYFTPPIPAFHEPRPWVGDTLEKLLPAKPHYALARVSEKPI